MIEKFSFHHSHVIYFRILFCILISFVIVFEEKNNSLLEIVWDILYQSPIFRYDSFEPLMASLCFGVNIAGWMLVDFYIPALHRFRIHKNNSENVAWKGRERALYEEAVWYLAPWLVIDYFFPRRTLPIKHITVYSLVFECVMALLVYDLLFFCGHYYVLHRFRPVFESIHAKHHTNSIIQAPDSIRHTFIDGTWDVMCSVIALNTLKTHPLSRSVYNVIAIALIVEAHCGYNMPYMAHNVIPRHLVAGPVVHDLHHRSGKVNFQKFFTYLDYFHGTLRLK